jgi:hypothetical protein
MLTLSLQIIMAIKFIGTTPKKILDITPFNFSEVDIKQ